MISVQAVGSVNVIKARSSLSEECLKQCQQVVGDSLEARRFLLLLDLSECPVLNSKSLEFILDSQRDCLDRGGKLVVADPQPLCREILAITGMDQHIAVFDDMRSALADFAQ